MSSGEHPREDTASKDASDALYRRVLDHIVDDCRNGQGQISARRVRAGVWNANATPDFVPEQYAVNRLLDSLGTQERYEGTPFNDFVGRLHDWPWPDRARTP